ncbi:AraC-type DNA-binding protein [Albimonas donghaensis]|uniref:AraC-type DNA-binding protein n=1 Tax=Albimonas donghaensis TaxID=356660 RepID=A0A1H2QCH0_9RHOB|nr:AraC-type DNA-binding protein [Albimonas donghaensis]
MIAGLALAGTISLEAVAKRLGTSPRTLQRRLNRQGVRFWALVGQSRFGIAGALLEETDLNIQEIAAAAGYSTPSAFARAFARWSGTSPSAYRQARVARSSGMSEWREMGGPEAGRPVAMKDRSDVPEES